MKRGLTLLEVVLSLAILGALMVAALGWIRVPARMVTRFSGPLQWEGAADAVLRRVHDDWRTGDFLEGAREPRIRVRDGKLEIRTRRSVHPGGPVLREYGLEEDKHRLVVRERQLGGRGGASADRSLLEGVAGWQCEIDEEETWLSVRIEPVEGSPRVRRIPLR